MAGVALAAGVGFLLLRRKARDVSLASVHQFVHSDERKTPGHELSGDMAAEIGDGRVTGYASELPAART